MKVKAFLNFFLTFDINVSVKKHIKDGISLWSQSLEDLNDAISICIYCLTPSWALSAGMYFVHSGLHDGSLQDAVGFINLYRG